MKKIHVALALVCASMGVLAQWRPGSGVANDHATGAQAHDVRFIARDGDNGYGYRSYDTAIGFTFLPWSFPNFESTVKGVRLNLGWGHYAGTYGLDVGTFSNAGTFGGIAVNWCGNVADSATGLQIGLVNAGGHARGLQIGLVNHVQRLDGVQIGLLNFARSQWSVPFINIGW
ncbi:MAG: LA_2272 family surface repeat-containing protein [Kiritimatiellia bacterium]